jgi:hypothetical protein
MNHENVPLEYQKLTKLYTRNMESLDRRNNKFFQILYDPKTDEAYFFKPRVRSLYEPYCRLNYFRDLRKKFKTTSVGNDLTFSTLTYSTKLYSPEEVSLRAKKDIALLMKRLRRLIPKLQYFYIVELTKKFQPHFHIIFNSEIPKKTLSKYWKDITGSYIVDIRKMHSDHLYSYMTSELLKSKKKSEYYWQFIYFNFSRLWSSSRGFFFHAIHTSKKYYILFKDHAMIKVIFAHALTEIQDYQDRLTKLPEKLKDYLLQICDGSWSDSIILTE